MIRSFQVDDMDSILNIWLDASRIAHDFVESSFWHAQLATMRDVYLPNSEVYVYQQQSSVGGFYALHGNTLAALFVKPSLQGQGIGKALIGDAKRKRHELMLTVYKNNHPACQFYLQQGFSFVQEQTDIHTGHREWLMNCSPLKTVSEMIPKR
ncbi:N-acetyltransferase [Agarivorans sp. QJM3NY_29]|uniref:N-acetyltransferase n=1 Tax=unclassified Agarivorans TaxID=2636026 RepID=UPI003D7E64A9